jgi:lysophospholipase L1-like esterase
VSAPASQRRGAISVLVAVGVVLLLPACDQYTATGADDASGAVTPQLTPAPSGTGDAIAASPCDGVGEAGAVATIETLRRIDRSCVDPSTAVVVRCDPALDPIAILGAGSDEELVFLGGSFAVPVSEVPQRAAAIGFGATGRYYLSQADDRLLYLEAGDGAERWLALARPRQVEEPPTSLMVGDSILDGSSTQLTDALPGWSLSIDAAVGRSSSGGIPIVESALSTPDVALLELGTNDHDPAVFRANADRILAAPAVAEADLIVWVTAHNPEPATPAVNREIVSAISLLPNASVADWDRAVPPEALNGDGVHLAAGNEGVFAEFLAPLLETWRAAVHHRGPARCAEAAVAALP